MTVSLLIGLLICVCSTIDVSSFIGPAVSIVFVLHQRAIVPVEAHHISESRHVLGAEESSGWTEHLFGQARVSGWRPDFRSWPK